MNRIFLCLAFIAVTVAMSAAEITLNGVLYYATSDTTMQVYEVDDLLESVEVLPFVTYKDKVYTVNEIKEWAFQNCDLLTNVKLPETIKYIRYSAFSGCTDLVSINIPHHIKEIEGAAFSGCSSLTSITIPAGIKEISNGLFGGCKSLKNVHLPIGLTSIGEGAFKNCKSLASIDIPESVLILIRKYFTNNLAFSSTLNVGLILPLPTFINSILKTCSSIMLSSLIARY
jgi:hypothetical protein